MKLVRTGIELGSNLFGANVVYETNTNSFGFSEPTEELISGLNIEQIRFPAGKGDYVREVSPDAWLNVIEPYYDENGVRVLPPELVAVLQHAQELQQAGDPKEVTIVLPTKYLIGVNDLSEHQANIAWTLAAIEDQFPGVVSAYEIGNEYWGAMNESEYARIADATLEAIREVFGTEGPEHAKILVQMASPGRASDYSSTPQDIALANRDIIDGISTQNHSVIDGLIEHYYFNIDADSSDGDSRRYNRIDLDYHTWRSALGDELELHITEWNNQTTNISELGLSGASVMIEMLDRMAREGVDVAHIWALEHNTTTSFVRIDETPVFTEHGHLTNSIAGATFSVLRDEIANSNIVDIDLDGLPPNIDMYAFQSGDEFNLVFAGRSTVSSDFNLNLAERFGSVTDVRTTTIGIDQESSDGQHFNPNTQQVEEASRLWVEGANYYINENDVSAQINYAYDLNPRRVDVTLRPFELTVVSFSVNNPVTYDNVSGLEYYGDGSDETVNGGGGQDSIAAGSGNDAVFGYGGHDILRGNAGDDVIEGGLGDDLIFGGTGRDSLRGGDDHDTIVSQRGDDQILSGSGYDVIALETSGEARTVTIWGHNNLLDTLLLTSYTGSYFDPDELRITRNGTFLEFTADQLTVRVATEADTIGSINSVPQGWIGLSPPSLDFEVGSTANDRMSGTDQRDRIFGEQGNDRIDGRLGNDFLSGGDGDDRLHGAYGADRLIGGRGDDTLLGGDGNDWIGGGAGEDVVIGGGGRDRLYGQQGDDTLVANGQLDTVFGGDGDDRLLGTHSRDFLFGGSGHDSIVGYDGDDSLNGAGGNDTIIGMSGNDRIYSNHGQDVIVAGHGEDFVHGGVGSDTIRGGNENDTVYGGTGNDRLLGERGDDLIYGGSGNDFIVGSFGNDTVWGGTGDDIIVASQGRDRLYGERGDDTIHGGDDRDIIHGGIGHDYVNGRGGNDVISGQMGHDELHGYTGADILYGGVGNDSLYGGSGDDQLHGDRGADLLSGGAGADTFVFTDPSFGSDRITDFSAADTLMISRDLVPLAGSAAGVLRRYAEEVNGNVLIDLGDHGEILFTNQVDLDTLAESIVLV